MSYGALKARWSRIALSTTSDLFNRSSHSLAVIGDHAYIFGGERQPRIPLPPDILVIGLKDRSERVIRAQESAGSVWPAARVGSALVAAKGALWLWGGRGGKDMGTFSGDDDLWRFDPSSEKWESLSTIGDKPERRSFHTLAALGSTLYLHAGCPAKGRLETLHSLDLDTLTWSSLPDAPGPARGGTVLAAISDSLVRFGGFAGYELGGPLDVYDTKNHDWKSVEDISTKGAKEGPGKRSVHSFVAIDKPQYGEEKIVALMALGEREPAPAELGHNGAGYFHDDAWALLQDVTSVYSWAPLPPSSSSFETPEPRGWFSSAAWGDKVVLQGGLNQNNERLADAWVLEVVKE